MRLSGSIQCITRILPGRVHPLSTHGAFQNLPTLVICTGFAHARERHRLPHLRIRLVVFAGLSLPFVTIGAGEVFGRPHRHVAPPWVVGRYISPDLAGAPKGETSHFRDDAFHFVGARKVLPGKCVPPEGSRIFCVLALAYSNFGVRARAQEPQGPYEVEGCLRLAEN
jgi:hypothetical protein